MNTTSNSAIHDTIKGPTKTDTVLAFPTDNTDTHKTPDIEHRPCFKCYSEKWKDHNGKMQKAGVWIHTMSKAEKPEPIDIWLCGEMHIEAIARDTAGRSFGQVLRFKNKLGHWVTWNMPVRLLAGRGDNLLQELLDMGLAFNYAKRNQIAAYISSVTPKKFVWTANQVGWFNESNFVLPDTTIGTDTDSVLFQTESNNHQEYNTNGTLEQWRSHVAEPCVSNPILIFTLSTAFAGALLKPCNMPFAGFHVHGNSSLGKTTGLKIAASVWGSWDKYKRTWKATANGLEGAAALFNDGMLALDEIGDCDPKELSDSLYLLGNGTGKQRANANGNAKTVKTWRTVVLSNGEKTLESHLAQKGFTVKAGQLVRFLQIPLFGTYGVFHELHHHKDGREFADDIIKHTNQFYGVAGRDYLKRLTRDTNTLNNCSQRLNDTINKFIQLYPNLKPQELRAVKSFALVSIAGELATEYGITGWEKGEAFASAIECFAHWKDYRGEGDTEDLQIKELILAYLETYGDSRFTKIDDDTRLHGERSGYWRTDYKTKEWLFTKSGLEKATQGYDLKQVLAVLKNAGWLETDKGGNPTKVVRTKDNGTKTSRFYCIQIPEHDL